MSDPGGARALMLASLFDGELPENAAREIIIGLVSVDDQWGNFFCLRYFGE